MHYAILCYHDEKVVTAWSKEEDDAVLAKLAAVHEKVAKDGKLEPVVRLLLTKRLESLAAWLGEKDFLEDRFTAGDLVMTTVLRDLVDRDDGVLSTFPTLDAHRRRCEARPAFGRALEAQLQVFREHEAA